MKYKIWTILITLLLFTSCDRKTISYDYKFYDNNFSLEITKKGDWRWDNGFKNYSLTVVFIPYDTTTYLIDFVSYGYRSPDRLIKQLYTNKKTVHIFKGNHNQSPIHKIIICWSISNKVYKNDFLFPSVRHDKWKVHDRP